MKWSISCDVISYHIFARLQLYGNGNIVLCFSCVIYYFLWLCIFMCIYIYVLCTYMAKARAHPMYSHQPQECCVLPRRRAVWDEVVIVEYALRWPHAKPLRPGHFPEQEFGCWQHSLGQRALWPQTTVWPLRPFAWHSEQRQWRSACANQ